EVVNITVGRALFVFRLVRETRPGKTSALTGVEPLVASIPAGTVWPPKDPEWADAGVIAYVFKVSEGVDARPRLAHRGPLRNGIAPTRFVVDYKAYVRWYYDEPQLRALQDDEQWFERFRRTFFPDQSYRFTLMGLPQYDRRKDLFLGELENRVATTP